MSSEIRKWSDDQQYEAAPIRGLEPSVHLLWMTPDPFGAIAAACRMYEGKPTYSLSEITDDDRQHYWMQARSTHLTAPLEFVKFHFFIEGIDRAFTHQMVRQRTAVYAQESMRFAVKENMAAETPRPPAVAADKHAQEVWDETIEQIANAYNHLVNNGIPAEEARGLLPHAATTRLHYCTDLRALLEHAGNRLCTQAQFHWRKVFMLIAQAISNHDPVGDASEPFWQYQELASGFRPVCFLQGRCPFNAVFDRHCSIKSRVEAFAAEGVPSSQWEQGREGIDPIRPEEWLADPWAARVFNV